ncbi:MAG: transcriptional regulator NrdR [Thermodesulfobacteriota bacterium]
MKCPFCKGLDNKVMDSRLSKHGDAIRRRRECLSCHRRFTTYERVEDILPTVIKKDGSREPFDRNKIMAGLKKACEKRPISIEVLEEVTSNIERHFQELEEKEIPSSTIGEMVMKALYHLDDVAYVRFASVYRQFKDITQFIEEVRELLSTSRKTSPDSEGK